MNLCVWASKYNTENDRIIKRKKGTLDTTIRAGVIPHYIPISVDSEKMCIGNKNIVLDDLLTMYISMNIGKHKTAYLLHIISKKIFNSVIITITNIKEEDIDKIDELFEFFIFSNDTCLNKWTSNMYETILTFNNDTYMSNMSNEEIKEYESESISEQGQQTVMFVDEKKYFLLKIFPITYYKEYTSKDYLVYNSRFTNNNYIDIWIKSEVYIKEIEKFIKSSIVKFVFLMALLILGFIFLISQIIDIYKDYKEDVYELKQNKINEQKRED